MDVTIEQSQLAPICLLDELVEIRMLLLAMRIIQFRRQATLLNGDLIPNGNCRWIIVNKRELWRLMHLSFSQERVNKLGEIIKKESDPDMRFYRLMEALSAEEIGVFYGRIEMEQNNEQRQQAQT